MNPAPILAIAVGVGVGQVPESRTVAYGTIRGRVTTPFGLVKAGAPVDTDCPTTQDSVATDGAGYYRLDLRIPYGHPVRPDDGRITCRVWTRDRDTDTLVREVRFGPTPWAHGPAIASFGAPSPRSRGRVVLTGRLVDVHGGRPLTYAEVVIPELHVRAAADSAGTVVLAVRAPPSCLRLWARAIGFNPGEGRILIDRRTTRDLGDIALHRSIGGTDILPLPNVQDECDLSSPIPPRDLTRFGSLVGRMIAFNGRPNAGSHVTLSCPGQSFGTRTDENGIFVIDVAFRRWITSVRLRRQAGADSVELRGALDCYLGTVALRIPLRDAPLRVTPFVVDQATGESGRGR